jgi:hypothetical protein
LRRRGIKSKISNGSTGRERWDGNGKTGRSIEKEQR